MRNYYQKGFVLLLSTLLSTLSYADINRIYHPYVNQNERELEYGVTSRDIDNTAINLQRLSIGYAWSDRVFTEVYLLNENLTHDGQQIRSYEAEIKLQLTEQGEYTSDWGLLFEISNAAEINAQEFATALLWEKELSSRWVIAANGFLGYEFGEDIQSEVETALRAQCRYRYRQGIEPAIEIYLDDKDWAGGPALMGTQKLSGRKKIIWELGWIVGLNHATPDNTLRFHIEYEF